MFNSSKQICRCITVKETVLLLKSQSIHPPLSPSLYRPPVIIKRYIHTPKKTICTNPYICLFRTFVGYFSPWFILRKLGIPFNFIIKFRRGLKRYSFPWLSYSLPTALAMGLGDILAQLYCPSSNVQHKKDAKGKALTKMAFKDLDCNRTIKFMLIGFLVMGPIRARWNAFICRQLSYNTPQIYLAKRVAMDVLVLSPILLIIGLTIWDFDHVYNCYPNLKPVWDKRLKQPFWDIMGFNLMTRPFIDLVICMLIPICFKKLIRRPYEVLFFTYVSSVIAKHKLGEKWKPPTKPPLKKTGWGKKK